MSQNSEIPTPRYCIISPCRDEADYVKLTLDSVLSQSLTPARWIIVDDGSTDGTDAILTEYERTHPCIKVIRRADRGRRQVGPGVVDAFYSGYDAAETDDFDYICKLDMDLDLPARYFEVLIGRMEENPRIGTCSGKPYFRSGDRLVSEACGDENSVGMTKLFRLSCFRDIGGFVREVMWDGIDGHRCRLLGWIAVSWDEPELRFEHLRVMGSSEKGIWTGRKRHGYGQWFMGTGLGYMIAGAVFRMTRHPLIVGGMAMLVGYLGAMLRRAPRYGDPEFRAFLRSYQWSCLLRGKRAATKRLNEARHRVWLERQARIGANEHPQ
tara:strand:- start:11805 stop:12776 length:972 start_codon:yes stop_codon:yes gene_type:complete